MTTSTTNPLPISEAKTPDLRNVSAALDRAFLSAQALAKQTNTFLIVQQNGQLVKLKVN
jgi:hypothetical protein